YNRYRYYDPSSGRFISKDPIGLAGGINVYQYAPNPLGWIDPIGLAKCRPCPDDCAQILSDSGRGYGAYKDVDPDSHHIIQDAAARNLPDYSRRLAPAVQLSGPSYERGSEHYIATRVQEQAGGGTYAAERRIGYKALRRAGLSSAEARCHIMRADAHFAELGVGSDTPLRIPGNRR
ncbi:RHS repeat-associated core domain-containing protein, partial [Burkholderia contaminans]